MFSGADELINSTHLNLYDVAGGVLEVIGGTIYVSWSLAGNVWAEKIVRVPTVGSSTLSEFPSFPALG